MRKLLLALFIVFSITFFPIVAQAFNVGLAWDASGDDPLSIQSYRIWYGTTSRIYTNMLDVGDNLMGTINSLSEGTMYYFAITAMGWNGLESGYSNEVRTDGVTIPGGQDPSSAGGCYITDIT